MDTDCRFPSEALPLYTASVIGIKQKRNVMPDVTTRVLTAHVPIALAERVDLLAARLDRSRGWIIKQALAAWLDQEEERNRLLSEAPRAIEDQTVSSQEKG